MAKFQGKRVSHKWKVVLNRAQKDGVGFVLTSGQRTLEEQKRLYREKGQYHPTKNPSGAAFPNPDAPHIRRGQAHHALDINTFDGGETRLQEWVERRGVDWQNTVSTEAWHGEVSAEALERMYRYSKAANAEDRRRKRRARIRKLRARIKRIRARIKRLRR